MKHGLLIFFLLSSVFAFSQDNEEELANFASTLIDYEVYNENIVAITRKNREYFMYFTDSKGAKLYESFDIFFATDLEIDCMGNLFVVGLDSAIQIQVTDYIKRVEALDIESYQANIRTCKALFEESLIRESVNNSLVYEPIDDSIYVKHPVLFTIQIWSDGRTRQFASVSNTDQDPNLDRTLQYDRALNMEDNTLARYKRRRRSTGGINRTNTTYGVALELTPFQVGDSLWVFDEASELLFVYDEYGKSEGPKSIDPLASGFKLCQDQQTQEVYFLSADGSQRLIQKVDVNGKLDKGVVFEKGLLRSSLKISNGYLYFRDSKGTGESIKRVRLN